MESAKRPRKACDLCYRKKMKCDSQEPRCSACVLYDTPCTHEAASRRKEKSGGAKQLAARREAAMKARIETLEEQLREASSHMESLNLHQDASVRRGAQGDLPPLRDALPVVEEYLTTFNAAWPLFDPGALRSKFRRWCCHAPERSDTISWATINVVLALAHQTGCSRVPDRNSTIASYLHNAQAVLSDIVSGPPRLINVQIPLGLAMLFWSVRDLGPSMILIATALRIAHRLRLHSKAASAHLPRRQIVQRNRVFWTAYILDRQMSMLIKAAPIQLDSDIDIDLPPLALADLNDDDNDLPDVAGFLATTSGDAALNFFRARIQLARIQGKCYEYVYSLAAQNATPVDRAYKMSRIFHALDDWTSQIPPAFRPFALDAEPHLARYVAMLYSVRLDIRAKMSVANIADHYHYSRWIANVLNYGKTATTTAAYQALESLSPPVSQGWRTLVEESKEYLDLYASVPVKDDFFISLHSCPYFTGLICLTAHAIFDTESLRSYHPALDAAADVLEQHAAQPGGQRLRQIRDVQRELRRYADVLSRQMTEQQTDKGEELWSWWKAAAAGSQMGEGEDLWSL